MEENEKKESEKCSIHKFIFFLFFVSFADMSDKTSWPELVGKICQ